MILNMLLQATTAHMLCHSMIIIKLAQTKMANIQRRAKYLVDLLLASNLGLER